MNIDLQALRKNIEDLINKGEYKEAKELCLEFLSELDTNQEFYIYYLADIAGFLIDIGNESIDIELIYKGIHIYENNELEFKKVITEQSYYYNLANGKSASFRLNNLYNKYPTLETASSGLIDAKNFYYKSYKLINFSALEDIDLQIITNLGIVLNQSGRSIEAIDLYDKALKENNNFVEALICYSEALDHWMRTSGCPQPTALYCKIYWALEKANKSGKVGVHFTKNPEK